MKIRKPKIEAKKFDLEKMEVAKLKNMHLIKGGSEGTIGTDNPHKGSSNPCDDEQNQ